jgi:Sugar (and other) transporter
MVVTTSTTSDHETSTGSTIPVSTKRLTSSLNGKEANTYIQNELEDEIDDDSSNSCCSNYQEDGLRTANPVQRKQTLSRIGNTIGGVYDAVTTNMNDEETSRNHSTCTDLGPITAADSLQSNDMSDLQNKDGSESDLWQTLASVAGNVLEWYDFAVFGYLSDILGEVFFSANGGIQKQTMESFLVFGIAFFMRPIGGLLFGYIGDYYGRKKALVISILVMAFPTFIMGLLPGYDTVGRWAIVFLVVVRLLQGLSVGGQIVSSLVYILENQNPNHWGFYGSFTMAAATL